LYSSPFLMTYRECLIFSCSMAAVPRSVEWVCPCNSQQVSFANETNVEDLKPEDLMPERIDEPVVDVPVPSTGEGLEHVRFRKGSVKQTGDVHGPFAPERFFEKKCGLVVQGPLPQVIGQIPDALRFLLRTLGQAFERSAKTCLSGSTQGPKRESPRAHVAFSPIGFNNVCCVNVSNRAHAHLQQVRWLKASLAEIMRHLQNQRRAQQVDGLSD